jgi:superfamily II DNA/RNA helicase
LPRMRQTLFFSATLSDDFQKLGKKFVMNPKVIEVAPPASTADTVAQHLVWTTIKNKRQVLRDILRQESVKNAVIFCNRKRDIAVLVKSLTRHGFGAVALHGDMTQSARLEALHKFKDGEVPLMIASDVAARGLDIAGLSHVFNFDIPSHAEDYVHRIGRTGRAGKSGSAFSIAASKDDHRYVDAIETLTGKPIPQITIDHGSLRPIDGQDAAAATSAGAPDKDSGAEKPTKSRRKKPDQTKGSQNRNDQSGQNKSRQDKSGQEKVARNRNRGDELPSPPDCTGTTFKDTDHVPAFLRR